MILFIKYTTKTHIEEKDFKNRYLLYYKLNTFMIIFANIYLNDAIVLQ